ncbi:MAG: IS110 family RNA-guided transposase [Caulobacteraceae bacterium]
MGEVSTIGLDTAKSIFQAHGADAAGAVVFRKKLTRGRLLAFFAAHPPCVVAMEACSGAHHWGREFIKLGHTVRLIPPQYVKPVVKRQKNDMADAEAICEAAQRPTMRYVPVKNEQQQASALVFRARDLLVRQRTQCVNAMRSHAAEYGWTTPKGLPHVAKLIQRIEDPAELLPAEVRIILKVLVATMRSLDEQIAALDLEIGRRVKADPVVRRLMTIPGVGPITATAITALAPAAESFAGGRHFAAWMGLTPLQKSTGGKQKLGATSKMGERTLRRLLVIGAAAVVKQAVLRGAAPGSWLAQMLGRKPKMLVIVALANKIARIIWALLVNGGVYRAPAAAV